MGAAIAAGSQLEKGIWALFVIAATAKEIENHKEKEKSNVNIIFQKPKFTAHAMEIRISASPIRLVNAVIIPAPREFAFW